MASKTDSRKQIFSNIIGGLGLFGLFTSSQDKKTLSLIDTNLKVSVLIATKIKQIIPMFFTQSGETDLSTSDVSLPRLKNLSGSVGRVLDSAGGIFSLKNLLRAFFASLPFILGEDVKGNILKYYKNLLVGLGISVDSANRIGKLTMIAGTALLANLGLKALSPVFKTVKALMGLGSALLSLGELIAFGLGSLFKPTPTPKPIPNTTVPGRKGSTPATTPKSPVAVINNVPYASRPKGVKGITPVKPVVVGKTPYALKPKSTAFRYPVPSTPVQPVSKISELWSKVTGPIGDVIKKITPLTDKAKLLVSKIAGTGLTTLLSGINLYYGYKQYEEGDKVGGSLSMLSGAAGIGALVAGMVVGAPVIATALATLSTLAGIASIGYWAYDSFISNKSASQAANVTPGNSIQPVVPDSNLTPPVVTNKNNTNIHILRQQTIAVPR